MSSSSRLIKSVPPQILTKISAQEKFKNWLSSAEVKCRHIQFSMMHAVYMEMVFNLPV